MRRLVACGLLVASCGPPDLEIDQIESNLNAAQRRARCQVIRDVARDRGLTNGALLGGVGDAETNLAHCWSEATWACQGPDSATCGGPVIAGAGDGPCSARQGGLGLFQFDAGTYDQTIARDGQDILLLEGNISHAVDFVIAMVLRSEHIGGVNTEAEALAWMNQVPIASGDPDYEAWISTVTHYYNGCAPTYSCWDERRGRYDALTRGVYAELGADFWMTPPPEPCRVLPPEGGVIEENDSCYRDGGPAASWRTADAGHGGRLRWTYAFDAAEPENFAIWSLELSTPGTYRIEVYTDAAYAHSKRARYTLTHAGQTDEVVIDQSAVDGFTLLGDFDFEAGGGEQLRLDDNTGEPLSNQAELAFDAIRVTPVEPDPEPDPPPERLAKAPPMHSSVRTTSTLGDGDPGSDDGLQPGGCTCATAAPAPLHDLLGGLAFVPEVYRPAASRIARSARSSRPWARASASDIESAGSTTSR